MANFLGAAFGFGARDVGLSAAMSSATKNLDKVNNLLDEQNKKGGKSGKVWGKIGEKVKQFNVASIASNVRELTGETGNLSNGLESMAVSYAQSAKPIIASMSLTGKEAKKMTSRAVGMAIGLNTSADAVAETFKAIHDAGAPAKAAIDAMGLSEKDWVKVTQTTGVTMQDYAGIMGDMVASWGASDKQAGDMVNNIMAIGKAAKVGTSAIKGAKTQLDALDAIFEQLPPSMARTSGEVQSLMESTYKLAGAFKEMGETEEQATALGQDTAKMFAEQAVRIEKLYAYGGEGALADSPLFKFLTQLGVTSDEAKDIIMDGSKDVVGGVQKINNIFSKMGGDKTPQVQYALGELNKAMGSSAAGLGWLASNTDTGTSALEKMSNMSVKGKDALKKYGNQAYSSGRTLQEAFDLAKEGFETQVRSIARANVRGLVGNQMKAYREVGKELKSLGSDETWGPLMNAVSIFDQMGTRGVFLAFGEQLGLNAKEASKMGVKFDFVFDKIKDVGGAMAPLMETMGMFGPLGIAAGGIVGFFMLDSGQRKAIWETIKPIWTKYIVPVWKNEVLPAAKEAWATLANWVGTNWPSWWNDKILPAIIGGIKAFTKEGGVGSQILDALKDVFSAVWEEFGIGGVAAAGGLAALFMGGGSLLSTAISGALKAGFDVTGSLVSNLAEAMGPGGMLVAAAGGLGIAIGTAISKELEGEADRQWSTMMGLSGTNEGERVARTGTLEEKQKVFNKLSRQKEEASRFTTTSVGDFFTKTLMGEETTSEKAVANADKQMQIIKDSIIQNTQDMRRMTGELASGDKALIDSALFEAENMGYAVESGKELFTGVAEGIDEAAPVVKQSAEDALNGVRRVVEANSPPEEGPLSAQAGNPLYNGGLGMMMLLSDGIVDGASIVKDAVSQVLNDSILLTMEEYGKKVNELAEKKSMLSGIAKSMARDFGGKLDLGTVKVEGEQSLSAKETFEAALNIPGLGGVIAAIASDGHKTRVLLARIQKDTDAIAQSDLVKNSKVNSSGGMSVVLPS